MKWGETYVLATGMDQRSMSRSVRALEVLVNRI
jgi:hypothetical protein